MFLRGLKTAVFVLLVCCAVSVPASRQGSSVVCDFCGKQITGRYVTFNKSNVHLDLCQSCARKASRCKSCNIPLRPNEKVIKNGEILCKSCAGQSLYCALCKKRIEGGYIHNSETGQDYCRKCYDGTPKCAHCKNPARESAFNPYGLCNHCARTLPRCKACGKPVIGNRFSFKFEDGQFCEDCIKNRPSCAACGVPVGNKYWTFPDGRAMCNACKERGILKREDAERLLKEVRRIIHRQLGLEIQHEIELVLEEMNSGGQIAAAAAKFKGDEGSPLGESELGLFRRRGDEFTIFLLYGVPREMMLETAAHELAHAWQAENCPATQSEQIREGFAQWVAAQVLKSERQQKVLAKLEARTDNPYGTGYQIVKRIAERYGAKRTIQKMKTME